MTALAIFVKTPGLSPIKTRLAAGIGVAAAAEFYDLAVQAVAEVAAASSLAPYWAVAEPEALQHPSWSGFPTLSQGEGGLGARLDHVFSTLQARHGRVLLIGADSPQTTPALLVAAARCEPFVMGRAEDGGFWLFGGARPIDASVWLAVPYSAPDTADRLLQELAGAGCVSFVTAQHDVDEAADLASLRIALAALESRLPAQTALLRWLRNRAG
jgi:glycosyltransferase A (GT-A) superfamily protein (DUF2064 family)